ncbi:PREDICTED: ATP synthase-coupling factor 6, mitochondrial [Nicrophorus vespilloides]|uniref:ATP synthase-coupling factor 6, mitochondrial n=1 Tax=Nicrophorus vespilloides TaxID=110193 RepID=A0ABM1MLQ0_NICVS|nr:PREDICTED: ATP synthase-coupling factor 6, mitochondrial [Nicrophorus vespilloides]
MLSNQLLNGVKNHVRQVICTRNLGLAAPALQKASDPIQQLFVDKLKEYASKSGPGYKLVEPSGDIQRELKAELEKAAKQYGGGEGVDMKKFPSFKFVDPVVDPVHMEK